MTAVVLISSGVASSLSFPWVFLMVPILFLFAPQAIKRDKRTLVVLALAVACVLGVPVFADEWEAVSGVCSYCPWYLCLECLIYG